MARVDMSGFAAPLRFSVEVEEDAADELREIIRLFPGEVARSLRATGFYLRQKMFHAIQKQGPEGQHWRSLTRVQKYRKIDRLLKRRLGRGRKTIPMGTLAGGLRTKALAAGEAVIVGALSPTMKAHLEAVQDGDTVDSAGQSGRQRITPKMRRLFFAAGVPLGKSRKNFIRRHRRPLVQPVFDRFSPAFKRFFLARLDVLLNWDVPESADDTAKRTGVFEPGAPSFKSTKWRRLPSRKF